MIDLIEQIEYKRFTINIYPDMDVYESPRDWDNLGTMWCVHSRYNLGDLHENTDYTTEPEDKLAEHIYYNVDECYKEIDFEFDDKGRDWYGDFEGEEWQIKRIWKWIEKNVIFLPLTLYDHSGLSMRTGLSGWRWDSGQVGYIYVTKKKLEKEFGWKKLTKKRIKKVEQILEKEVEIYSYYLEGAVYGYVIEDEDGNEIDDGSCWGFFGYDWEENGLLRDARGEIDWEIKKRKEERLKELHRHFEQVKTYIKNHVPLIYRKPLTI